MAGEKLAEDQAGTPVIAAAALKKKEFTWRLTPPQYLKFEALMLALRMQLPEHPGLTKAEVLLELVELAHTSEKLRGAVIDRVRRKLPE